MEPVKKRGFVCLFFQQTAQNVTFNFLTSITQGSYRQGASKNLKHHGLLCNPFNSQFSRI